MYSNPIISMLLQGTYFTRHYRHHRHQHKGIQVNNRRKKKPARIVGIWLIDPVSKCNMSRRLDLGEIGFWLDVDAVCWCAYNTNHIRTLKTCTLEAHKILNFWLAHISCSSIRRSGTIFSTFLRHVECQFQIDFFFDIICFGRQMNIIPWYYYFFRFCVDSRCSSCMWICCCRSSISVGRNGNRARDDVLPI